MFRGSLSTQERRKKSSSKTEKSSTAKKSKSDDNATTLTSYFREMASLDVLKPEEEFKAAREQRKQEEARARRRAARAAREAEEAQTAGAAEDPAGTSGDTEVAAARYQRDNLDSRLLRGRSRAEGSS